MSSHFAKPENALRKAKDLLRANKESSALKTLQQILTSKRYKTWSLTHEKIMFFYIELAVDLHRPVSDALFQYRSICSTQNTPSLEKVLKKYRQLSEQKARDAQHLADTTSNTGDVTKLEKRKLDASLLEDDVNTELEEDPEQDEDLLPAASVDDVEDLEEESPESLMLQAVSGQGSRDRKDRQILAPWVKYLWETYRTILEVLRNNGKLEQLYHKTARQAFLFCRRFKRSMEFRRVGEILRNHLTAIQKYTHQANNVDLNSPETQKLYLETRFQQLKIASEMELWQEAYRAIEDIHENMRLSRTEPKPEIMKTYYDKLAAIFWASENYLFHAYSLNRFYQLSIVDGSMDVEEKKKKLATAVLLATLCIPPRDRFGEDPSLYTESEHEGNTRLANLLGFKKETPTRARLITGLISSGVFEFVNEDVRILYELSENKFGPLSLHAQVKPILERLMIQGQSLSQYIEPIQNLIVLRVIQQLATVFKSIRLDKFLSLVPSLPLHHIERLVMSAVQSDQVQLRMDHRAQLLHFSEEGMEGPRLRDQLSILARSLQRVADIIEPMNAEDKLVERQHVFHAIQQGVDSEHDQVFIRQQEIEKRKQESEREAQERERREQEQKARAAAERKREEQKRLADESARREQERQKREKEDKERQMKEKLAQTLKEQLAKDTSIDSTKMSEQLKILENPLEASKQDLIRAREEILQRQQYETEKRRKEVARRIDYITRAMRIEEKELLVKQMELQKITDREQHEADFKKYIENAKAVHAKLLEDKKRLERMGEQRNLFHAKLLQRRQEEYEKKKAEYDKKLGRRDAERARLERARDEAQAALDRYRQEKEEEERARREEEERLAKQAEEERALKEKIARDRRAKLEESAAKQRAREAEIEAKEAARRAALTGGSAAASGGVRPDERVPAREEWRGAARDTAPAPAAAAAATEKPKEERDWSKARRTDDEPPAAAAAASENRPWTRRGVDASRDRPTERPTEEKKWRGGGASASGDRPERDWGRDRDRASDRPIDRPNDRPAGEERWRSDKPRDRDRDAPTERPWARRGEEGDAPARDAPARGGDESSGGGWRGSRPSDRPERSERPTGGDRWGRGGREDERERERPAAGGAGERPWVRQDRDRDRERPNKDGADSNDRRDFRRTERPSDRDDGPRRDRDEPRRDDATSAEEDGFTPVGRRPAARR